MPINETPFFEPIYTRRNKFNHEYDITLNEISTNSNNQGFSNFGYCYTLINKINEISLHEKKLFIRHQLTASSKPMRWLLDLELLIERNSWKSDHGFYNQFEDLSGQLNDIIKDFFNSIEEGNFNPTLKNHEDEDSKTAIIFNTVEACEYLNISKSTMYKLTSSKSISFYKPNGKNMYFKKDELDDFLLQSKQISNSELEAQSIDYIARKHNF